MQSLEKAAEAEEIAQLMKNAVNALQKLLSIKEDFLYKVLVLDEKEVRLSYSYDIGSIEEKTACTIAYAKNELERLQGMLSDLSEALAA